LILYFGYKTNALLSIIKEIMNQVQIELTLPNNFVTYAPEMKASIMSYLYQLNPIEKKAYKIAKEHLGSSFNIAKSNGFNDWLKENKK